MDPASNHTSVDEGSLHNRDVVLYLYKVVGLSKDRLKNLYLTEI